MVSKLPDHEIWEVVSVWKGSDKVGVLGVYDNREDAEKHFDSKIPKSYVRYFLCKLTREVVAFYQEEEEGVTL